MKSIPIAKGFKLVAVLRVPNLASSACLQEIMLQEDRLFTLDTRALNHILTHSADYRKPEVARRNLAKVLGEGAGVGTLTLHCH